MFEKTSPSTDDEKLWMNIAFFFPQSM